MQAKVSVIIPTLNRAHIIKETLNSVQKQSYKNWECIIIDDGSTDGTDEIIQEYLNADLRFIYVHRPETRIKGAATCRNIGVENSTGDYIQFLDSDDLIAPNKFEIQLAELAKTKSTYPIATCKWGGIKPMWKTPKIYNGLATYTSIDRPIKLLNILANRFTYLPLHVYLLPMDLVKQSGNWNEQLTVNDDGEFFSRIILNATEIVFCPYTFALYRTGSGNRISSTIIQEKGIKSYIKSWNIIADNIYNKTGTKNHTYVRQAKKDFYERMLKENPEICEKEKEFFKDRRSNIPYITKKIASRIKDKLTIKYIPLR
jgi:glycosyltransferase involved in cell wall biosynthesis